MLHRQLRSALEEIFGVDFVNDALARSDLAQSVIFESPVQFKEAVLGFQRLNYRDEQTQYARQLDSSFGVALICSLLDTSTREFVAEQGLNYL